MSTMPDKTQADGNHFADRSSNLTRIVSEAYHDLNSQSRRILPNLELLQELSQTFLAGGIIDDRKYLVGTLKRVLHLVRMSG
jgi:hypothetical protein